MYEFIAPVTAHTASTKPKIVITRLDAGLRVGAVQRLAEQRRSPAPG